MATFNSPVNRLASAKNSWHHAKSGWILLAFLLTLLPLFASDGPTEIQKRFAERIQKTFIETQKAYLVDTNDLTTAQNFTAACFDAADAAEDDTKREGFARAGIATAGQMVAKDPKSAAGHYYLAMNFGQLAKALAPSLTAYHLIKEIEKELKIAQDLDEKVDYAGPARDLGLLYRDAPGWPLSIGSKRKAREFLERAARVSPDYIENRLNLAESYQHWKDLDAARRELNAVDALWSNAHKQFSGPHWDPEWADWTERRTALHGKLDQLPAPPKTGP
jgi:hypothetical protein